MITFSLICACQCSKDGTVSTRWTGYRELFGALWTVTRTTPCQHPQLKNSEATIPPGCTTVSGFGDDDHNLPEEKLVICLTAHSQVARWRVLISLARIRDQKGKNELLNVMLRGKDCCFKCAVDQCLIRSHQWFLVL